MRWREGKVLRVLLSGRRLPCNQGLEREAHGMTVILLGINLWSLTYHLTDHHVIHFVVEVMVDSQWMKDKSLPQRNTHDGTVTW